MIAACNCDLIVLVTDNAADFLDIPALKIENWVTRT